MRNNMLYLFLFVCTLASCVQKTYKKTVVFELDVSQLKDIQTVGLRGDDKPLDWDAGIPMTAIKKDTTYTVTATFVTGYKFTEVKFAVNDEFELKGKNNRRINFSEKDTTYYKAVFDKE
ncbi:hypothetical protein KACHI17_18670 [Sediminibacterium sp. KACHI17]|uniref:Uncharacterized protein n=1 Tax=Sediminibacterium sp. KACHI17 TaxID=1751071 RepID=A0AAT9GK40_9BACT